LRKYSAGFKRAVATPDLAVDPSCVHEAGTGEAVPKTRKTIKKLASKLHDMGL
jgi:hypothetical protein